jgi:VWFA-related protein
MSKPAISLGARGTSLRPAGALLLAAMTMAAQEAPPTTFHAGTRLVEVEVVVRGQPVRPPGVGEWFKWVLDSGPPFGPPGDPLKDLTKDDFTLLDAGKPQPIAVFRTGALNAATSSDAKPVVLPPGAVSNRQDSGGRPMNGATAVLIDFLNAKFGCRGYERLGMSRFLSSFAETDSRIALYTLGVNLHVLQDFTDDPKKLMETAATLDQPHGQRPDGLAGALHDLGDVMAVGGGEAEAEAALVHGPITVRALKMIIQHLSSVPGRKNLVWLMEDSRLVPPAVVAMAQQANIVFYPVLVGAIGAELGAGVACIGGNSHAIEDLAAATGGRAFYDALDLTFAVRAAEEDTSTHYVLGFYPAEETLDGKYHAITVKLHNKAPDKQPLEVHYRPGYLATKAAIPTPSPAPQELFEGPNTSARIGLVAQATPDAQSPGLYDVRVTVDLHDIHLERRDGHFTGRFDFSVPNPSIKGTVKTGTAELNFTDEQLVEALENGFVLNLKGVEPVAGEIRVVVRDRWTDIAGSLRIPVVNREPKQ